MQKKLIIKIKVIWDTHNIFLPLFRSSVTASESFPGLSVCSPVVTILLALLKATLCHLEGGDNRWQMASAFTLSAKKARESSSVRIILQWVVGTFPVACRCCCHCHCCCSLCNCGSIFSFRLKWETRRRHHHELQVAIYTFCRTWSPQVATGTWSLLLASCTTCVCVVFCILAVLCEGGRVRMRGTASSPVWQHLPNGVADARCSTFPHLSC